MPKSKHRANHKQKLISFKAEQPRVKFFTNVTKWYNMPFKKTVPVKGIPFRYYTPEQWIAKLG
jgi:hypothetical protein